MKELNIEQTTQVNGGALPYLVARGAAWAVTRTVRAYQSNPAFRGAVNDAGKFLGGALGGGIIYDQVK